MTHINLIETTNSTRNYHLRSDPDNNSKIVVTNICIDQQATQLEVSVISVNFQNVIRTLKKDDFIKIYNTYYYAKVEKKNQFPQGLAALLSDIILNGNVIVTVNDLGLLVFSSPNPFRIDEMSYNIACYVVYILTNYQ